MPEPSLQAHLPLFDAKWLPVAGGGGVLRVLSSVVVRGEVLLVLSSVGVGLNRRLCPLLVLEEVCRPR